MASRDPSAGQESSGGPSQQQPQHQHQVHQQQPQLQSGVSAPSFLQADDVPPAHTTKRRRLSPGVPHDTLGIGDPSNASSNTPYPTLAADSPQSGSSRDRGTMQRSTTPPDGGANALKYTRTGRVSKALKGQRVHHCEECGKTYTRHEHLKRHQQNHKPGAFPCDIPGCSRSFNREDLLIRHKARHNDPQSPPTRRNSIESSGPPSESGAPGPTTSAASFALAAAQSASSHHAATTQPPSSGAPHDIQTRTRKDYIPITELQRPALATALSIDTSTSNGVLGSSYPPYTFGASSPEHSSGGEYDDTAYSYAYASHGPYPQPHPAGSYAPYHGDFTYQGPTTSRSPVSASSSNPPYGQWYDVGIAHQPYVSAHAYGAIAPFSEGVNIYAHGLNDSRISLHIPSDMMAEERDEQERYELSTPTTALRHEFDSSLDASTHDTEIRYLGAYWHNVHPQYPMIFRPHFSIHTSSPLLKAAMLALGAQSLGGRIDMTNARILHERCIKVLKKRSMTHTHTYRVCDMQAIVLIEIYAIFRARRLPIQFSKLFEDVYQALSLDNDALSQMSSPAGHSNEPYVTLLEINNECKQRLLAICYTLDYQNAALFGRQKTGHLGSTGVDLLFPRPTTKFDDPSDNDRIHVTVKDELDATQALATPVDVPHDIFGSMLLLSGITDMAEQSRHDDYLNKSNPAASPLLFALEQSPRVRLAFHTLMLTASAPIREVLAVAGESWIMSEKLGSQEEYTHCQSITRQWARVLTPQTGDFGNFQSPLTSHESLTHAFEILKIQAALKSRTSLLFQEWAVYLAAITIWAHAYVATIEGRRGSRAAGPLPNDRKLTPHELEQSVNMLLDAGPGASFGSKEAKNVLMWAKAKIELVDVPHQCGITNGALDVLGKLITRGSEEGWC